MANGKNNGGDWGKDQESLKQAGTDTQEMQAAAQPVVPLSDNEIIGLRALLHRSGFDHEKGSF